MYKRQGPERASEHVKKPVLREAVVIQMTWPGAPTLYYGDEAGVCGWTDPDSRRTYPWGKEDLEPVSYTHLDVYKRQRDDGLAAMQTSASMVCQDCSQCGIYAESEREDSYYLYYRCV